MWSKYGKPITLFFTSFYFLDLIGTCDQVECEVRCECDPGYLRDTKTDKCVQKSDCTSEPTLSTCGKNEQFTMCKQACREPRCGKGILVIFWV